MGFAILTGVSCFASAMVSPTSLNWNFVPVGGRGGQKVITLTNTELSAIAISGIALAGANPSDFKIYSKTCGSTLAASASCTANVVFAPTTTGNRSAILQFSDSASNAPQAVTLTGLGVTASALSPNPSSLVFPTLAPGSTSAAQSVLVANATSSSVTFVSVSISGANASDFAVSHNSCTSTLVAGGSCSTSVVFKPTASGARSATLQLTDSGNKSPQFVALSGAGSGGTGSVSAAPSSMSFGSTAVGSSSVAQSAMLTNTTLASISLNSVAVTGTNASDFSISSTTCGSSLAAGSSCVASVAFTPAASGTRSAALQFTDSATNSPQYVALSGTGSGGTGSVSAAPSGITFGSTSLGSSSAAQSATLMNTTSAAVAINSVAITGTNASDFSISSNNCASNVSAGSSCVASVVFTPTASGTRSATLQFSDSAFNSPQSVALTGTGSVASGAASLSPTSLNWNFVSVGGRGAQKAVTLTNTGTSSISISSVGIGGSNPGDFRIMSKTCGSTLAASASCTASVAFAPTTTGARSASLQFTDSATNSPQSVALTGLGVTAQSVSPNPSSLTFANTSIGTTSVSQMVLVANSTSSSVSISSVSIGGTNSGDFAISRSSCTATLVAGGSCTTWVAFTPTAGGMRSAVLQFMDSATNSPQSVVLTGSAPSSGLTISPQNPTVQVGGTVQFSASAPAVWSATCGSITAGGLYTAPATAQACTVMASASDGSGTDASTAVNVAASSISITPSGAQLHALNTQVFTANEAVNWSASCGSITSAGVYTAPPSAGTCTITATASSGTAFTATATANVDLANYTARRGGGGQLGLQSDELALTPSNVNANTFGLQWTAPVDGWVNAQPLYLNALMINGVPHNVVFVVTANDSVYAFDGDTGAQLWQVSLIPSGATAVSGSTVGFTSAPLIGILSTPVIDPSTNTMYVVSETSEQNATYFPNRLHALDVTNGAEKFSGPVLIDDPQMAPVHKLQRPGLTLANGNVYVAIGSMQDMQPYHGFLFAFNAQTLAQEAVWNVTPTGSEGGIWMGAEAPSVDASGNIYVTTGNGTLDGTANFGEAAVKLSPMLQVLDYFAPYNFAAYDAGDLDLGSGAVMVLPDQNGSYPHELIVCGKPTPVYVLDRDNLGQLGTTSDNVIQRLDNEVGAPKPNSTSGVQACFTGPALWGQNVYFGGKYDYLKEFTLDPNTGLLSSAPVSQGTLAYGYPGTDLVISSNGSTNGIVWTIDTASSALIAVDATNLTSTLFTGSLAGGAIRWTAPTPVNGHVYVGEEGVVFGFGLK